MGWGVNKLWISYDREMNVAILHFHLRRGGVSSVIFKQASSLALAEDPPQVVLLTGTVPESHSPAPFLVIPELDYDTFTGYGAEDLQEGARGLARVLSTALGQVFPGGCDLLHVHNPLLCKNKRLLGALHLLQAQGIPLLIQIHDLAEDFRPQVYDNLWPYPESCDYAVINHRDRDNLIHAGLAASQVHFLPNPVTHGEAFSPREGFAKEVLKGRKTALYPVRAIRRKNMGEALLLSLFLPPEAELAVTLPPTSPGDRDRYEIWKDFAREGSYPVRFEAGKNTPLPQLYDQAFCVVTTSVKEGFGYSYLDPLIQGLPVVGREIPHLIKDFSENEIRFPGLYPSIRIPRKDLSSFTLNQAMHNRRESFRSHYAPVFQDHQLEYFESLLSGLDQKFSHETVDFGALDEGLQSSVLLRIKKDGGFRRELVGLNPFLTGFFENPTPPEEATRLRQRVLQSYSEKDYAREIQRIYHQALTQKSRGRVDKTALLASYLKPGSFFLVSS